MSFDLDDEELKATRRLHGLDKLDKIYEEKKKAEVDKNNGREKEEK